MAECDREGAMTQNDDCCRRFVRDQKRLCEGERISRVDLVGIHYLAMASLQRPRPIWTVDICSLGLRKQGLRRKPCESKCHGSAKSAEKASARRYIVSTLSKINHLFPLLR